jgi:predicted enzyme related to lactoylglutathione lyase
MKRVTGIGGVFFKSQDPAKLKEWYQQHLGIESMPGNGAIFNWRDSDNPDEEGMTIWSLFKADTKYFDPSTAPFMINYRVEDLHGLLAALRAEGVEVDDKVNEDEFGKFAWVMDPEGNRIELWEPPKDDKNS